MKGRIITVPIAKSSLSSGVVGVTIINSTSTIVTLSHIDALGNWVAETDSDTISVPEENIFKLIVISESGSYPLKISHWKKVLKTNVIDNEEQAIDFSLITSRFRKGSLVKECSLCYAHFEGAKSQGICMKCTEENSIAHLISSNTETITPSKRKRPRMVAGSKCKHIALTAFRLGSEGKSFEEFNAWYKKQS